MQPPRTLQQQIHRCKIADHHVEVQVKALLNHLRGNNNGLVGSLWVWQLFILLIRSKLVQHSLLNSFAPSHRKPRMKQNEIVAQCFEFDILANGFVDQLCAGNGIADDGSTPAICQRDAQFAHNLVWVAPQPLILQCSRLRGWQFLRGVNAVGIGKTQTRIRCCGGQTGLFTRISAQQFFARGIGQRGRKQNHRCAHLPQPA